MKVLWFEISTPQKYKNNNTVTAGWQDSLENIVRNSKNMELLIAFETTNKNDSIKVVDNVTYIPVLLEYSFLERKINNFSYKINERKIIKKGIDIINQYTPDIIHVFGNEWPFGLLANHTNIPVVIHIQGSIIPYNNALYPPKYNGFTFAMAAGLNLRKQWHWLQRYLKSKSRLEMEKRIWKSVHHYMGRTSWDKALVNMLHPNASYHHVDEALRPIFLETKKHWYLQSKKKIKLISIGCSNFWKGIDVMLKTAHVLIEAGVDFEWKVAGNMPSEYREVVEKKEKLTFKDNNITIIGFTTPEQIIEEICESTLYVHTAYIENSPNSICEAQIIGIPIISTMVGGISTLIQNGHNGDLLPANDPWQIANAIVELANNPKKMTLYSENGKKAALQRHSKEQILKDLLNSYQDIIQFHKP